jgi:Ran GTPase-activating protein (RanGAP) involved in mRNA processing and transport
MPLLKKKKKAEKIVPDSPAAGSNGQLSMAQLARRVTRAVNAGDGKKAVDERSRLNDFLMALDKKPVNQFLAVAATFQPIPLIDLRENRIESLDLSENNLGAGEVVVLARYLRGRIKPTELNIKNCEIGDMGKEMLAQAIKQSKVQFLECDQFSVIKHKVVLKQIGRSLTPSDAKLLSTIVAHKQCSLTLLDLSDNLLSDDGGDLTGLAALTAAVTNHGQLSKIALANNRLATAEGGKMLSAMISGNTVLTELNLMDNHWPGEKCDGEGFVKNVVESLKNNTTLQNLDMRLNHFGAKGARRVTQVLKENETLLKFSEIPIDELREGTIEELDLHDCKLTTGEFCVLAHYLMGNTTCTSLSLADNFLACGDVGIALAGLLEENSYIEQLDFSSNYWWNSPEDHGNGTSFARELAAGLKENMGLTDLDIRNNAIADAGTMAIGRSIIANPDSELQYMVCDQWGISEFDTECFDLHSCKCLLPADALLLGATLLRNENIKISKKWAQMEETMHHLLDHFERLYDTLTDATTGGEGIGGGGGICAVETKVFAPKIKVSLAAPDPLFRNPLARATNVVQMAEIFTSQSKGLVPQSQKFKKSPFEWTKREDHPPPLVIRSPPGTGKTWLCTALMYHLLRAACEEGGSYQCLPLLVSISSIFAPHKNVPKLGDPDALTRKGQSGSRPGTAQSRPTTASEQRRPGTAASHRPGTSGKTRKKLLEPPPPKFNMEISWVLEQCCRVGRWPVQSQSMWRALYEHAYEIGRVVLIVDGADEIASRDYKTSIVKFIQHAAAQGNQVVVTSNPDGIPQSRHFPGFGEVHPEIMNLKRPQPKNARELSTMQQDTHNPQFFHFMRELYAEEKHNRLKAAVHVMSAGKAFAFAGATAADATAKKLKALKAKRHQPLQLAVGVLGQPADRKPSKEEPATNDDRKPSKENTAGTLVALEYFHSIFGEENSVQFGRKMKLLEKCARTRPFSFEMQHMMLQNGQHSRQAPLMAMLVVAVAGQGERPEIPFDSVGGLYNAALTKIFDRVSKRVIDDERHELVMLTVRSNWRAACARGRVYQWKMSGGARVYGDPKEDLALILQALFRTHTLRRRLAYDFHSEKWCAHRRARMLTMVKLAAIHAHCGEKRHFGSEILQEALGCEVIENKVGEKGRDLGDVRDALGRIGETGSDEEQLKVGEKLGTGYETMNAGESKDAEMELVEGLSEAVATGLTIDTNEDVGTDGAGDGEQGGAVRKRWKTSIYAQMEKRKRKNLQMLRWGESRIQPTKHSLHEQWMHEQMHIPTYKVDEIHSETKGWQTVHMSLQAYLAANWFYDFVISKQPQALSPENIHLLQPVIEPTNATGTLRNLVRWFDGKDVRAKVLNLDFFDHFLELLADFPDVSAALFPGDTMDLSDTNLNGSGWLRLVQFLGPGVANLDLRNIHRSVTADDARKFGRLILQREQDFSKTATSDNDSGSGLTCLLMHKFKICPHDVMTTEELKLPVERVLTDLDATVLAVLIEVNPVITRLYLGDYLLDVNMESADLASISPPLTSSEVIVLSAFLQKCPVLCTLALQPAPLPLPVADIRTLAVLDLSGRELNMLDGLAVAPMIKESVTMSLNLSNNLLTQPAPPPGDRDWFTYQAMDATLSGLVSLCEAANFNHHLEVLDLSRNMIGPKGAVALADALHDHPTLRTLDVTRNSLGPEGVKRIVEAISGEIFLANRWVTKLTKLVISDNKLATREGGEVLAALLADSTIIETLDISNNNFYISPEEQSDGAAFAEALCVGLRSSHVLTLDLSFNFIKADGAVFVAEALRENERLTALDLGTNNIVPFSETGEYDYSGVEALAKTLRKHNKRSLHKLGLASNALTDYGCNTSSMLVICNAIRDAEDGALTELDITGNDLSQKKKRMVKAICRSKGIALTS